MAGTRSSPLGRKTSAISLAPSRIGTATSFSTTMDGLAAFMPVSAGFQRRTRMNAAAASRCILEINGIASFRGAAQARNRILAERRLSDALYAASLCVQVTSDRLAIHRLAEVIALSFMTAERGDKLHLLLRFDTFGDNGLVEGCAEARNRADNRPGVAIAAEIAREGLIDLDLVERKFAQVVDRGISSAEIVERHRDAEL